MRLGLEVVDNRLAQGRLMSTLVTLIGMIGSVTAGFRCPSGWEMSESSCYFRSTAPTNWFHAVEECRAKNATLVEIRSEEENMLFKDRANDDIWIGLRARGPHSDFRWASTNDKVAFSRWSDEQPNRGGMYCGLVLRPTTSSDPPRWANYYCSRPFTSVCDKKKGASGCETTDWLPIGDKCFLFNPNRTDWFSARERCQDLGGDLAVISNMEENTAVEGLVQESRTWIGLWDRNMDNVWRWLDQSHEPLWTYWDRGAPLTADVVPERCVTVRGADNRYYVGRWMTAPCITHQPFICQRESLNNTCGPEWTFIRAADASASDGACYVVSERLQTWHGARDECRLLGGNLAVIKTPSTQRQINEVLSKRNGPHWIGLSDLAHKKRWTWLNDTSPTRFGNWYHGEPSGPEGQNCVLVYSTQANLGKWRNVQCTRNFPFICEISDASCMADGVYALTFRGHCYVIQKQPTYWIGARNWCGENGARLRSDLVVIDDQDEMQFIKQIISPHGRAFWIGLNSRQSPALLSWLSDTTTPVNYTNWDDFEPSVNPTQDCVKMYNNWWYDVDCLDPNSFVCQRNKLGDRSFYDFRMRRRVYKAVEDLLPGSANFTDICTNILGTGSTLPSIRTTSELQKLGSELSLRDGAGRARTFWIKHVDAGLAAPKPIDGECLYLDTNFPGNPQLATAFCCEPKAFLCEKLLDTSDPQFDYMFNNTIYKFVKGRMAHEEAESECTRLLSDDLGRGTLIHMTSDAELAMVSAEIRARHLGSDLHYWIDRHQGTRLPPESANETDPIITGGISESVCPVLTYPGFPDSVWDNKDLVTMVTNCSQPNMFVCQKVLPQQATKIDQAIFREAAHKTSLGHKVVKGLLPEKREEEEETSCTGACLGFAIAVPLAGFVFLILGVAVALVWYRSQSTRGSFSAVYERHNKQEVTYEHAPLSDSPDVMDTA